MRLVGVRLGEVLPSTGFECFVCCRSCTTAGVGVETAELLELVAELSDSLPELSDSESDRSCFGRFLFGGEINSSSESSSEDCCCCLTLPPPPLTGTFISEPSSSSM